MKAMSGKGKKGGVVTLRVYRHTPGAGARAPHYATYRVDAARCGPMVGDALDYVKAHVDPTLAYRRACGEGVCGSCAMSINGANGLACMQRLADHAPTVTLRPLPHFRVVRDLVVDLDAFFDAHAAVAPWLRRPRQCYAPPPTAPPQKQQKEKKEKEKEKEKEGNKKKEKCMAAKTIAAAAQRARELYQSPAERARLDGLYECVLCGCCSGACPEYWWGESGAQKFLGPAALLQAHRWLADSRDGARAERLRELRADPHRAFKCHNILGCNAACPKGLNPARSVDAVRKMLLD